MAQRRLKIWGLIGGLVLILCHTAMAQCASTNVLKKGDFEQSNGGVRKPWYAEGKVEIQNYNARSDRTTGWNALRQPVLLSVNVRYELTAVVRTSRNMRDGYLGFRGVGLPKPVEAKFGPVADFKTVSVPFTPTRTGSYDVFIGFWALDREAWIEVDYVRLEPLASGCNDVITKPAN